MPLIPSNYINSWYRVQDKTDPKEFYLIKNIRSTLSQTVERKNLIQGEVGTHVMSIREQSWNTYVEGEVLILPKLVDEIYDTSDIFDLFLKKYAKLRKFFKTVNKFTIGQPDLDYYLYPEDLLTKAQIELTQERLFVRLTFLNHYDQMFDLLLPKENFNKVPKDTKFTQNINAPYYSQRNNTVVGSSGTGSSVTSLRTSSNSGTEKTSKDPEPGGKSLPPKGIEYYSRFAKFYDVKFFIPEDNIEFIITRGNINVEIDYLKHFYINSNTSQPFYEPKGYFIQGEVEIIIPVDIWKSMLEPQINNYDRLLPGQNFMQLVREKVNCSISLSDGRTFKVGLVNATTDFDLYMTTDSLPSATIRFETYASNF